MAEPQYRASAKYGKGTWFVERTRHVRFQIFDRVGTTKTGKDVSAASLVVHFRAWGSPTDTQQDLLVDVTLTKVVGTSTAGDTGIVEGYVTFTAAAHDIKCEVVIEDQGTANAATRTGYREFVVVAPWPADVHAAGPQAVVP